MAGKVKYDVEAFTEIVKAADECATAFINLVKCLHELIDTVSSAVNDTIAKFNALRYEKINCEGRDRQLQRRLKRAAEEAFVFAGRVGDLYQYGSDKARQMRIRAELCKENGNHTVLYNYISELQRRLSKCGESYQKVQETVNKLIEESEEVALFCDKKASQASAKKKVTNGIGGTVAAGSAAAGAATAVATGGAAISAVVGPFTLGIGTIVGLGVTAVAAAVVGGGVAVGTGIATYQIASSFGEVAKGFKHLVWSFNRIQSCASKIEDFISVLKTQLDSIAYTVDNANAMIGHSEFMEAFDSLCKAFGQPHEASEFQKKLMETDSELKARFNEVLA